MATQIRTISTSLGTYRKERRSSSKHPDILKADDILRSFKLSADDSKKYSVVNEKFEGHLVKRRNVIFERAKFNSRKQDAGESVDAFITALYALADRCNYGTLHDEMIRDRIVVGIRETLHFRRNFS